MTRRPATAADIRKAYKEAGDVVRISRDGKVEFKQGGNGPWLHGRYVEEYEWVTDGKGRDIVILR